MIDELTRRLCPLILLTWSTSAIAFEAYPDFKDARAAPFTEQVIEIYQAQDGTWLEKLIQVPALSNRLVYVCFKLSDRRLLECFYIDRRDGSIDEQSVLPKDADT